MQIYSLCSCGYLHYLCSSRLHHLQVQIINIVLMFMFSVHTLFVLHVFLNIWCCFACSFQIHMPSSQLVFSRYFSVFASVFRHSCYPIERFALRYLSNGRSNKTLLCKTLRWTLSHITISDLVLLVFREPCHVYCLIYSYSRAQWLLCPYVIWPAYFTYLSFSDQSHLSSKL